MNERIAEFAGKCWHPASSAGPEWFDQDKFAELIVAKCIAQCEIVAKQTELTNVGEVARKTRATADSCAMMIKLYFEATGANT